MKNFFAKIKFLLTDGALFSPPKLEAETMDNRQTKIDAGTLNVASGLNKAHVTSSAVNLQNVNHENETKYFLKMAWLRKSQKHE